MTRLPASLLRTLQDVHRSPDRLYLAAPSTYSVITTTATNSLAARTGGRTEAVFTPVTGRRRRAQKLLKTFERVGGALGERPPRKILPRTAPGARKIRAGRRREAPEPVPGPRRGPGGGLEGVPGEGAPEGVPGGAPGGPGGPGGADPPFSGGFFFGFTGRGRVGKFPNFPKFAPKNAFRSATRSRNFKKLQFFGSKPPDSRWAFHRKCS